MFVTSATQWMVVADTEMGKAARGGSSEWGRQARHDLGVSLELRGEGRRVYEPLDGEAGSGQGSGHFHSRR